MSTSLLTCHDCKAPGRTRVDLVSRSSIALCDGCVLLRANRCPLCGADFGRQVKRQSRCKACDAEIARCGKMKCLSSPLATPAICQAFQSLASTEPNPSVTLWVEQCCEKAMLEACAHAPNAPAIESAFAAALHRGFESALTRERLQQVGMEFARMIWLCGGNPRPIQRTVLQLELEGFKSSGAISGVRTLPAADCCASCRKLAARKWTIDQALLDLPLPCRECEETNSGGFGWCRCCYQPTLGAGYEEIAEEMESEIQAQQKSLLAAQGEA